MEAPSALAFAKPCSSDTVQVTQKELVGDNNIQERRPCLHLPLLQRTPTNPPSQTQTVRQDAPGATAVLPSQCL